MNYITFGTLMPDGTLYNIKKVSQSIFYNCPFHIMDLSHYREDGSCKCTNKVHRDTVMKKWGYRKKDFKNIPLID